MEPDSASDAPCCFSSSNRRGFGLLHRRLSLLAAVWVCIALGATRRDRGGGRTTPCRRARHAGLRNAPPPDSRHLARHDCACVRPTLSPGAVEVLTEGSNYTGRRITYVGRKPSVARTLLLGRAELARARPRTRPELSLVPRRRTFLFNSDVTASRDSGTVQLASLRCSDITASALPGAVQTSAANILHALPCTCGWPLLMLHVPGAPKHGHFDRDGVLSGIFRSAPGRRESRGWRGTRRAG